LIVTGIYSTRIC